MHKNDTLYRESQTEVADFIFNREVVAVFNDMIRRSVPGYEQILRFLPTIARQNRIRNGSYYDLGCSLGAGMLALAQGLNGLNANIIGIDSSPSMIKEAKKIIRSKQHKSDIHFNFLCQKIQDSQINEASMVLLNFTLQFIPISHRPSLLQNIYQNLRNGGVLILSEKIQAETEYASQLFERIHHQFKADQGYSDTEIQQKRQAIENVLLPERLDTHIERLQTVGFQHVSLWLQNLQFISIIAIK